MRWSCTRAAMQAQRNQSLLRTVTRRRAAGITTAGHKEAGMSTLDENITVYDNMRDYLETELAGKWVVFHNEQLAGSYDEFEDAAVDAIKRFGRGPYLIRKVGEGSLQLPPRLWYQIPHAHG